MRSVIIVVGVVLALVACTSATVYFKDTFDEADALSHWKVSNWKKSDGTAGRWEVGTGPFFGDAEKDKGLRTTQDARFYAISRKFDAFSNRGKDLVVQFQVRHPQKIDCGGGYIKLLPEGFDGDNFNGETPYLIMFGPDICGTSTRRTHIIFNFQGKNLLTKKEVRCETDELSHVYTLVVRQSDETYEVYIDGEKKESGSLYEDWDFTLPKEIDDPNDKKPSDWVDSPKMDDPTDTKPANWDDIPKMIPNPDAKKPDDWDDEADGTWEAPTIPNPEYKGEWKPRQIDNPAYKGTWKPRRIPNPDYVPHNSVTVFDKIGGVGIELWQVKSGTVFDNIIITDSLSEAEKLRKETFDALKDKEREKRDEADKAQREEEERQRKRIEEEKARQDAASKDEEEDEEEEDDDSSELAEKLKNKVKEEL